MDETTLTAFLDSDQPTAPTMAWSEDERQCASCGAGTTRLWNQAGRLVCPDCKDWSSGSNGSVP